MDLSFQGFARNRDNFCLGGALMPTVYKNLRFSGAIRNFKVWNVGPDALSLPDAAAQCQ